MALTQLGALPIGSIVKLNVYNALREFIVVQHGRPGSTYDNGWNDATILLFKDIYTIARWNDNDYRSSYFYATIHNYNVASFVNWLDADIRSALYQVKVQGTYVGAFILSGTEVGLSHQYMSVDGAPFSYFTDSSKRIAYDQGKATGWWTRSLGNSYDSYVCSISPSGTLITTSWYKSDLGVRPALSFLSTMYVTEDGRLVTNQSPTIPASITVPDTIFSGKNVQLVWAASTDPEGNDITYELQRSINGAAYAAQYTGALPSYQDASITRDINTVQYRVRSEDSFGASSGWLASDIRTVIHNLDPTINGEDMDLGVITTAPEMAFTVDDPDINDTLTVDMALDGIPFATIEDAVRGQVYTFALSEVQFMSLQPGSHVMTVTVSDSLASATRTMTFARQVNGIEYKVGPVVATAMPEKVLVSLRALADDSGITLMVCNNMLDDVPTWEPAIPARKYIFSNTTKTADSWAIGVWIKIVKGSMSQIVSYQPSGSYI